MSKFPLLFAGVCLAGTLAACTPMQLKAVPAHRSAWSLKITLDQPSVKAGTAISGHATLTNNSIKAQITSLCGGNYLIVGLGNKKVPFRPVISLPWCVTHQPPGKRVFPISVRTNYPGCTGNHINGFPQCSTTNPRIPNLPAGTYHVYVEDLGLSNVQIAISPKTVIVTN